MKIMKLIGSVLLSLCMLIVIFVFEANDWPAGSSIAGIILGFILPWCVKSGQDMKDTTSWKSAQTKLIRGGFINQDTIIRISFAYLFRIKIGDRYLLVKNERGTGKYQPAGGVYKFFEQEKTVLKNYFHVIDDDKIPIDESSRDDYRLRLKNKYLRKFMRRFDTKAKRENISNLSREFKEELISTGVLNWNSIRYRYCGRHIADLSFGEHFQIYELLLADVVELLPNKEQEQALLNLSNNHTDQVYFATADEIKALGIRPSLNQFVETIADHTKKTLQENETQLIPVKNTGKEYTISFE